MSVKIFKAMSNLEIVEPKTEELMLQKILAAPFHLEIMLTYLYSITVNRT